MNYETSTTQLGQAFGMQLSSKFLIETLKIKTYIRTSNGIYWGDKKEVASAIVKYFSKFEGKKAVQPPFVDQEELMNALMFLESCEGETKNNTEALVRAAHYCIQFHAFGIKEDNWLEVRSLAWAVLSAHENKKWEDLEPVSKWQSFINWVTNK